MRRGGATDTADALARQYKDLGMAKLYRRGIGILRQTRLVAIGSLTVALFTLGFIFLVRIALDGLGRSVKEGIGITIELAGDDAGARFAYLKPQLEQLSGVKAVEFVSADEAARTLGAELGENPVDVLGYNPLNATIRLSVEASYINADSLQRLEGQLHNLGVATNLNYRDDLLSSVEHNISKIEWGLWAFLALQALLAFIMISNTTKLMIYAERHKIRTLTLVGASSWFVSRPILTRSFFDAILAIICTLGLLAGLLLGIDKGLDMPLYHLLDPKQLIVSSIALGVIALVSNTIASMSATRRYIRMDGSKIHLV